MQLTLLASLSVASIAVMGAALPKSVPPSTPSVPPGIPPVPHKETPQEKCIRTNGYMLRWTKLDGCTECHCPVNGIVSCTKAPKCVPLVPPPKGSPQEQCIRDSGNLVRWIGADGCSKCDCLAKDGPSCFFDATCKPVDPPRPPAPQPPVDPPRPPAPQPPSPRPKDICAFKNGWKSQWTQADGCTVCVCNNNGNVSCSRDKKCVSPKPPAKGSVQEQCIRMSGNVVSWIGADECTQCDCLGKGGPSCSDRCMLSVPGEPVPISSIAL